MTELWERAKSRLDRASPQVLLALIVVQLGLHGAALSDLYRRSAREVRGPRWLWAAASFVNFVGPAAYFAFGRRRR